MPNRPKITLQSALTFAVIVAMAAFAQGRDWRKDRDKGPDSAGNFDYYALVLSWSPTHCASEDGDRDEMQCARRDGRRYAFVLHGLWPQYERGYPESCRSRDNWVPPNVIDGMLDIMPSKGLVIHEYKKHGTCSGLNADQYFALARRSFQKITVPRRYTNPYEALFVSPDELVDDFVAENPGLKPDMVGVVCSGPGSRFQEIRICLSKDGTFRSCGPNEDQGRLCRANKMNLPPVRSSR